MNYKDLRSIQETYNEIHSEEVVNEGLAGMVDKASKAAQGGLERMGVKINRTPRPTARPSVRTQDTIRKNQSSMEEVDVFDIVKGHLIDEHNLSEDVALQLMSILDEETRADIMEYTASMSAGKGGATVKMTADGKEPIGDRLMQGITKKVGGLLQKVNPNALKSKTVEPRKPLVQQNNSFEPEGELVDEGSCGSKKKKKSKKGGY